MNRTSTDKIRSATPFLLWFRQCLPKSLQTQVQPYLDRPYQLDLKVLECCDSAHPLTVREIAQLAGVAQETTRQVLHSLKEGGMPFAVAPARGWQSLQSDDVSSQVPLDSSPESQTTAEYIAAAQE